MAITTHFKNDYRDRVVLGAQQPNSVLESTVEREVATGELTFFDQYDSVSLTKRVTRNQPNTYQETPRKRRALSIEFFEFSELFDWRDEHKLVRAMQPDGQLERNVLMAFARKKDETIINAFDANAKTGQTGSTTTPFDTNQDVAIDYEHSGTPVNSNLTISKLRRTLNLLESSDVEGPFFLAAHPNQKMALLRSTEVTSADFASVKALVNGEVNSFMGFEFKWTSLISQHTSNQRYAFAYSMDAVKFAMDRDIRVEIDEIEDRGHAIQLAVYGNMGAARQFENKIVRINCDDTK